MKSSQTTTGCDNVYLNTHLFALQTSLILGKTEVWITNFRIKPRDTIKSSNRDGTFTNRYNQTAKACRFEDGTFINKIP